MNNNNTELLNAFSKLSELANEESCTDDIPKHFIPKIAVEEKKENTYTRNSNFSKDKSLKIENQKRLKFLEELSELRDKPIINSSSNPKASTPIYLRASQIMKNRNLKLSSKKLENTKKQLATSLAGKKNNSSSPQKTSQDFLEHVRVWQLKKEKSIKSKRDLKDEREIKDLIFSPKINEKSKKIVRQLREAQKESAEVASLAPLFCKKTGLSDTFHPDLSEKTRILTRNRTTLVFDRLYPKRQPEPLEVPKPSPSKKRNKTPNFCDLFNNSYSINSGAGRINSTHTEENHLKNSMTFLVQQTASPAP